VSLPYRRVTPAFMVLVLLQLSWGQVAGGQNLPDLVDGCVAGNSLLETFCQKAALGAQAAQGLIGLAAAGGTALPGSASTMGWRTKGSPRLGLGLRGTLVRGPLFDLSYASSSTEEEAWDGTASTLNLIGVAGLFDGFSPTPTVGGVGSLDLMASGHWIALPGAAGFEESSAAGWGLGGRLGIFRESFSLPGVSLSVFHRTLGTTSLWDMDPAGGEVEVRTLSLRGVVGKDLWGVGFVAGAGWDRYSGEVSVEIQDRLEQYSGELSGDLRSNRRMAFLGASLTYLVLQFSAEVGLAEGFDPELVFPRPAGTDPSSRTEFGSLAVRLTF